MHGRQVAPLLHGACEPKSTAAAVRFARDVSETGAPEEIRTPDPQIRSLLLNQGSPLLCSSRRAARMEPHRDGGPAAPHDCFQRLHSWRSMFGGQSHFLFALFGQSRTALSSASCFPGGTRSTPDVGNVSGASRSLEAPTRSRRRRN
jgi:hypothetical protein